MEQLNISQLRNLWLRSPDERLTGWRNFRIDLQHHYDLYECNGSDDDAAILQDCLNAISTWWYQAPIVNMSINPYEPSSWPTVWEILDQGECCKYSRGLAMAYNLHYLDSDTNVTVDLVRDHKHHDEYMIANFGGKYALNSLQAPIIFLQEIDYLEIRQSTDIRAYLLHNQ